MPIWKYPVFTKTCPCEDCIDSSKISRRRCKKLTLGKYENKKQLLDYQLNFTPELTGIPMEK